MRLPVAGFGQWGEAPAGPSAPLRSVASGWAKTSSEAVSLGGPCFAVVWITLYFRASKIGIPSTDAPCTRGWSRAPEAWTPAHCLPELARRTKRNRVRQPPKYFQARTRADPEGASVRRVPGLVPGTPSSREGVAEPARGAGGSMGPTCREKIGLLDAEPQKSGRL